MSANLMKPGTKRKRTRAEIEEEKHQVEEEKQEIESIKTSKKKLELDMEEKDVKLAESSHFKAMLSNLYEQGFVDKDGYPTGKKLEPNIVENEDME